MPEADPFERLTRMAGLDLERFAKKLALKLARRVGGSEARVSVQRAVRADAATGELVVDDRVETRIRPPASLRALQGVPVTPPSGNTDAASAEPKPATGAKP